MNRIVATLSIGFLALAFIGHLHGYAVAHTGKLVQSIIVEADDGVGARTCERETVVAETGCVTRAGAFVAHGVGSSCSFFAVPVSAESPGMRQGGRPVHWSEAAERLLTAPTSPILRPPILVA